MRPKCTVYLGVKWPEELLNDLADEGQRHTPPKSIGDVIKDCCEFRMTLIRGLRLGYYHLRTVPEAVEEKPGDTHTAAVTPERSRSLQQVTR